MKSFFKRLGFREFMIPGVLMMFGMFSFSVIVMIFRILSLETSFGSKLVTLVSNIGIALLVGALAYFVLRVVQFIAGKMGIEKNIERMKRK